jgi:hypothetical protein
MKTQIIEDLSNLVTDVKFKSSDSFYWSPENNEISYNEKLIDKSSGKWALLHEVAHAKLKHTTYKSDLGLLKLEVEAWDEAKNIGKSFKIHIDDNHIQDCLDTYRDWLYRRSKCPNCGVVCLQISPTNYRCHNCHTVWAVSASRFCRPYRLKIVEGKEKRLQPKAATFS